jgi:asparagine synthase (glutamine-hydrolysing)
MSGIAGILNFGEAPVDAAELSALADRLSVFGPDGRRVVHAGSVGQVYRAFHTNRHSRKESQPLVWPAGQILAWNGRLDNREDLISKLRFTCGREDLTDATIVLSAHQQWGIDFLAKLTGDFVLSLWDERNRLLLLARDPFGVRQLFFTYNSNRVIWSSCLDSLLEVTKTPLEIDDEYVADYLSLYQEPRRTPYKGFYAVEPGHVVVVSDKGNINIKRFWTPDPEIQIRYTSDREYEEQFRSLFSEAVRCRLRADRPVWADVSGGLDSSSIVFVADQVLKAGEAETPRLETASYVDYHSPTFSDGKYIAHVERERGVAGVHLDLSKYSMNFPWPSERFLGFPSTSLSNPGLHEQLCEEMRMGGARVLLSGLGGDQVLWNSFDVSPVLSDLIVAGKCITFLREIKNWSQILRRPYVNVLWKDGILPFLPRGIRAKSIPKHIIAPWFQTGFVEHMHLRERSLLPPDPFGFKLPSSRMQSSMLLFIISSISGGQPLQKTPIEITYPFLHRPLVEFLMAIPFDQKLRAAETRSVQRRALQGIVPEEILRRKSKGGIAETLCRSLVRERSRVERLFQNSSLSNRGYVDIENLRSALTQAFHGSRSYLGLLVTTVSLEIWLQSVESHGASLRTARNDISSNVSLDLSMHGPAPLSAT